MTQSPAPSTTLSRTSRAPRRWWAVLLLGYWIVGASAVAVLPWTIPLLPHLLSDAPGPYGTTQAGLLAGSIVLGWLMFVPVAVAVGLALGLASAAVAGLTRRRASGLGRWGRYLAALFVAYVVVVVAVHFLAPTATVAVISYAGCASLLTVGSCFLIAFLERPRTTS